jgi:hypothetical protein
MSLRKQFEYHPNTDLMACQIGINKWEWTATDREDDQYALNIMKAKKFDVLPFRDATGNITKYYSTREWNNYSNLNLNKVDTATAVYYRLSIADLVRKFSNDKVHYYFLTDGTDIIGLVSLVNLNSHSMYNYLYFILSDMEQALAGILQENLNLQEIIAAFEKSDDDHLKDVLEKYRKAEAQGVDNSIFEFMYLQTVGITIKKLSPKLPDEYKKLNKFTAKMASNGLYNKIRNRVMHPVRQILSDDLGIEEINQLLLDYAEIKELIETSKC